MQRSLKWFGATALALGAALIAALPALNATPAQSTPVDVDFGAQLAEAAEDRIGRGVVYDGSYQRIEFPMGDVAPDRGVCTDLVVRAYRALGVDLQALVHADMRGHFDAYPKNWGLSRPDTNIDHRRVPNLETFFKRAGASLPLSEDPNDYRPGDLVSYRLAGGLPHIAVVSDKIGWSGAPMIIHNIGGGPELEDALFDYRMIGHYRYAPLASAQ